MLSRPHSPVAEQAGTGEAAGTHPPASGLPLPLGQCMPEGQDTVLLCVSGDRIALLGAGVCQ